MGLFRMQSRVYGAMSANSVCKLRGYKRKAFEEGVGRDLAAESVRIVEERK